LAPGTGNYKRKHGKLDPDKEWAKTGSLKRGEKDDRIRNFLYTFLACWYAIQIDTRVIAVPVIHLFV
jgi:hypothetical protein